MKIFLKHKTSKKIKIMMWAFLLVNLVLAFLIVNDFLTQNIPFYYIFFIFVWLALSIVFRKDKTIKWDKKTEKVVKNTEISTVIIIVSIIAIRKILLPDILEYYNIGHITTITLIITFWFFFGKLYFMWDKLKDLFCEVCEK